MYMMRRILDEGPVDEGVFFVFADTGRELPETHRFVYECERRWGQKIHRVERRGASTDGTAFDRLLADKHAAYLRRGQRPQLPGPRSRYCTIELKRAPAERFMVERGISEYDQILGIRADEHSRAARIREKAYESRPVHPDGEEPWMYPEASIREHRQRSSALPHVRYDYVLPLAEDGKTERDVLDFWRRQPFDLGLETYEGNCTDCYMKATWKRVECIRKRPDEVKVWIRDEEMFGSMYREDGPSFAELHRRAMVRLPLLDMIDDSVGECLCHD
jgi:3'-phosphoadenosine 5'-phosphosulfate sulfotransferase (PAPS reductase)/FAD synthetase